MLCPLIKKLKILAYIKIIFIISYFLIEHGFQKKSKNKVAKI